MIDKNAAGGIQNSPAETFATIGKLKENHQIGLSRPVNDRTKGNCLWWSGLEWCNIKECTPGNRFFFMS